MLEALKNGYYQNEVSQFLKRKKTKRTKETEEVENKKHQQAESEKILKLRAQFQTPELVENILSQKQGCIGYDLMFRDWQQGKINKLLQGFVDSWLLKQDVAEEL